MSYQVMGFTHTLEAGADLSSSHQRFVHENTSGKLVLPSAGGDAVGVTISKAALGAACPFQFLGIAQVIIGTGGLTPRDKVASDASGGAILATTGQKVLGICIVGGTAGQVGSVLLVQNMIGVAP